MGNNERLNEVYNNEGLKVIDFWMGIRTAGGVFIVLFLVSFFLTVSITQSPKLSFLITFIISIIATLKAYNVNKEFIIKNGKVIFPASDVENSFMAMLTLKPLLGIFYTKELALIDIIEIKKDGYGSSDRKYPLTIIDIENSNSIIFTSRQKRDEFHTKLSFILNQSVNNSSDFGE